MMDPINTPPGMNQDDRFWVSGQHPADQPDWNQGGHTGQTSDWEQRGPAGGSPQWTGADPHAAQAWNPSTDPHVGPGGNPGENPDYSQPGRPGDNQEWNQGARPGDNPDWQQDGRSGEGNNPGSSPGWDQGRPQEERLDLNRSLQGSDFNEGSGASPQGYRGADPPMTSEDLRGRDFTGNQVPSTGLGGPGLDTPMRPGTPVDSSVITTTRIEAAGLDLDIRRIHRREIPVVIEFCLREGWPILEKDLKAAYHIHRQGLLGAFLVQDGSLVSHCAVMPLNMRVNVISLFVTRQDMRGRGIGRQLFDYARKLLGEDSIAIDCPVECVDMFSRWGFRTCPVEYIDVDLQMDRAKKVEAFSTDANLPDIVKLSQKGEIQDVALYDRSIVRYMDRLDFFQSYTCPFLPVSRIEALCAYKHGNPCGYAFVKKLPGRQFFLAPVVAEDEQTIRAIILALMRSVATECDEVMLRVPSFNADKVLDVLQDLVGDTGQNAYMRATWCRMFFGEEIILDWEKIVSVGIHPYAIG